MLTIGIPTYNYPITALVTTLVQQCETSNIAYEILVVDDASTQATIVKENKIITAQPHCRYIGHASNLGRTAARARIAKEATYDWLLFFDADVIPKNDTLVQHYIDLAQPSVDAIFGGLQYEEQPPVANELLRWSYGRAREEVTAEERSKTPYVSVVSACFMIRTTVFKETNPKDHKGYGLDIHFANNLSDMRAKVLHIDNPVIHLGLEDNRQFLEKTKSGIRTLVQLTQEGNIPKNYKALQRFYLQLKRWQLLPLFNFVMKKRKTQIENNLTSKRPSLFWFDMYRVYEYAKQMKDA